MLKYKSGTSGECIDLSSRKIKTHVKTAGFYDSGWEVEEIEEKIGCEVGGFRKKAKVFELVLDFIGTKEEREEEADHLFEITETDIINKEIGKLTYNGYEIQCYIIENKYVGKTERTRVVRREAKAYAPYPFWIKEEKYEFRVGETLSSNDKIYPNKYPYRYANGLKRKTIVNKHFSDSNIILKIYGPVVNPQVIIGGNAYIVYNILENEEYLEINTMTKTIEKIKKNGEKENLFHYKGRQTLKKIQTGANEVIFGEFNFDLTILQERSEPPWKKKR